MEIQHMFIIIPPNKLIINISTSYSIFRIVDVSFVLLLVVLFEIVDVVVVGGGDVMVVVPVCGNPPIYQKQKIDLLPMNKCGDPVFLPVG
jgi:hypothetical protein